MKKAILDYFLASLPWVEYRVRLDILGEAEDSSSVKNAHSAMIGHPLVQSLARELSTWPGAVLNSHKSAGQLYHKLVFLCDIGLTAKDEGLEQIAKKILDSADENGIFRLCMNIPEHFGGSGLDEQAWALCDTPLLTYSLAKLGYVDDSRVKRAIESLMGLARDNGFPCAVSKNLGKFRGPGKKDDPCPYATLIMLKLLSLYEDQIKSREAACSVETLLNLWDKSTTLHPYMFFMGTDFRKLKAPLIWYDILNVADTLSHYDYAVADKRFKSMINVITNKADEAGLYTPESEWKAWKAWDFGQKKQPSAWLSFLVHRIQQRAHR